MTTITLDTVNMKYTSEDDRQAFDGESALIPCATTWTIDELSEWLPDFDFDAIETIKGWLSGEPYVAEGMSLKIWID